MLAAALCREMKWNYEEYCQQPVWFIKMLSVYISAESEHIERKNKK